MLTNNCDVLILGGGCSGLAIGYYYSKQTANQSVIILEQRQQYNDDRSWCFWLTDVNLPHQDIIYHQWQRWQLSEKDQIITHQTQTTPYAIIKSKDYYQKTTTAINQDSRQTLCLDTQVIHINQQYDHYVVETNHGKYLAKQLIDTRPDVALIKQRAALYQIFYGMEIESDKPIFDASTAQLMTNLQATNNHCQFDYLLPFSSQHALIEVTCFSRTYFSAEQLKQACEQRVNQLNSQYNIKRIEAAVLPMGIAYQKSDKKTGHEFNQQHGTLRASSGYGFLRIQQQAQKLALQIAKNKRLTTHAVDSRIDRWMDGCFCRVLQQQMQLSPKLFLTMASNLNAQDFAYFMNGHLSWLLRWRVIKAMPSSPFLRAMR